MRRGLPVGINVCSALILVMSFLPWVTITAPLQITGIGGSDNNPLQGLAQAATKMFGSPEVTMSANAWNGNVSVAGLALPNWLVVVAGLLIAGVALLGCFPYTRTPKALLYSLWGYGILHLLTLAVILPSVKGQVHVGYVFTWGAWVALLPLILRNQATAQSDFERDPAVTAVS